MQMPRVTENIGKEEFFFAEPRYVFINDYGTWSIANNHCKKHGGHLASAESLDEVNNLVNIVNANNGKMVWLGGKEETLRSSSHLYSTSYFKDRRQDNIFSKLHKRRGS